jgi:hypothetical protein
VRFILQFKVARDGFWKQEPSPYPTRAHAESVGRKKYARGECVQWRVVER